MKQTFVRIAAVAAFAAASGAAWAHADGGCMGASQPGTTPKAGEHRHGPQGQGMRGMGMGGDRVAMQERMARMHGDGAVTPGQPGGAMPCRDGAGPRCPLAQPDEHKH